MMLYYIILCYIILVSRLALAGLMQEWLDAEVPLLSKAGVVLNNLQTLRHTLRGACAKLGEQKWLDGVRAGLLACWRAGWPVLKKQCKPCAKKKLTLRRLCAKLAPSLWVLRKGISQMITFRSTLICKTKADICSNP